MPDVHTYEPRGAPGRLDTVDRSGGRGRLLAPETSDRTLFPRTTNALRMRNGRAFAWREGYGRAASWEPPRHVVPVGPASAEGPKLFVNPARRHTRRKRGLVAAKVRVPPTRVVALWRCTN